MKKDEILAVLYNLAMDEPEDSEGFYLSSLGVIQCEAIKKKIEFDGYFQTKWEEKSNQEITSDSEYFESKDRIELYVFSAALIDQDIFDYLEYVWSIAKSEELTENVLHREIYFLKEKGVRF